MRDVTRTVSEVMGGTHHHEPVSGRYTPRRGQAYVQVQEPKSDVLVLLAEDPREQKSHRGKVLALGPPARLTDHPDAPEVPWGVAVGDDVLFVLAVWMDRMRVLEFTGVRGHVAVVAQGEVLAVVDSVHDRETTPELP